MEPPRPSTGPRLDGMHEVRAGAARSLALVLGLTLVVLSAACSAADAPRPPEAGSATTTTAAQPADGIDVAWATTMNGSTIEDEIDGVAADDGGSLWVTGKFERSTTLGGEDLVSKGAADIPLARFAPDGSPQWVRSFGGSGEDNLFDIDATGDWAVGAGWFEGTVAFDDVEVTSNGSTDCVIVAFDGDGSVRWARTLGGPGPDGCNEVVVSDDGTITTSLDTGGGWTTPAGPVGTDAGREVVLVQLDAQGADRWAALVSGPRTQRGKSLAVADDATVALGGDTTGDVVIGDLEWRATGRRTDAWVSVWSPDGEPVALTGWGGPGNDIAKGLAFGSTGIWAVGQFEASIDIGEDTIDAGSSADLTVALVDLDGAASWVGSVEADAPLAGAEVVAAPDGGVLFGVPVQPGTALVAPDGTETAIEGSGAAALAWWSPDGSMRAWGVTGTATPGSDEIARTGDRVYLELVIRGDGNNADGTELGADAKDGSVWALDLLAG